MSAARELIVVGAGNLEVAKLVRAINRHAPTWNLVGYVDDDPATWGRQLDGVPVLGEVERVREGELSEAFLAISVGATRSRRKLVERIGADPDRFATLVHPGVDLWGVTLEPGSLVLEGAVLSPDVRIGAQSILSLRAVVAHDSSVGPYSNLTPGVLVNGRCRLEEGVHVGSGAVLLPGIKVGAWASVGAGAVVTRRVAPHTTVFGVPARVLSTAPEGKAP